VTTDQVRAALDAAHERDLDVELEAILLYGCSVPAPSCGEVS
jgi:hypothetical protein